jgi:photosystem II stability/assembly factor-like uncharacterized protein
MKNSLRPILAVAVIILVGFPLGFSGLLHAQEWTFVGSPITTRGFYDLHFLDRNTGWLVGIGATDTSQAVIIHTANGGTNWEVQSSGVYGFLEGIFFANKDTGYAVGSDRFKTKTAYILKTTDGGQLWQQQICPVAKANLTDVYFVTASEGWTVGQNAETHQGVILHSSDGTDWSESNFPVEPSHWYVLNAVRFVDASHGWIVGAEWSGPSGVPFILHTSNGGQTWVKQTHSLSRGDLIDLFFVGPDTGWVVGRTGFEISDNAILMRTINGGASWNLLAPPEGNIAASTFFISGSRGYLMVVNRTDTSAVSTLYATINSGDSWAPFASSVPDQWAYKLQVVSGSLHIFALFSKLLGIINMYSLQDLQYISVTPPEAFISLDDSFDFNAEGYDRHNSQMPITPTWSTTGGSINPQTGVYTATTAGDFTVTATVEGSSVTGTAQVHVTATSVEQVKIVPTEFALEQNYPNPFNPTTTIEYCVKEGSEVTLKIYDVRGQAVATLMQSTFLPGSYRIIFNAQHLPSGIYFYKIQMQDYQAVRKMVKLE